jgi:hypothetical protein
MHLIRVRWLSLSLILGLLVCVNPVAKAQENTPRPRQESKKKGRVKAEEPTVMTVTGKVTPVEKDRNIAQKMGHGIRTGLVGTARAAANVVGWFFDPRNETTSGRDRQKQSAGEHTTR